MDETVMDETKPAWKLTPEQNREVWAYVNWKLDQERRAKKQGAAARHAVSYCREALASDRTDWDVIQYIKYVIKHYGL